MGLTSYIRIRKTRSGISKMAELEIPGLVPTTETDLTVINRQEYLHVTLESTWEVIAFEWSTEMRKDTLKKGKNSLPLSLLPKWA